MRINRTFLYIGVFLVALGAVLVAADLGSLDLAIVRDTLRLWPIAVVLIGVALVVRRSPIALPLGLLAATAPGLALGGAIAVGPRFISDCIDGASTSPAFVRDGSFSGVPDITIRAGCGSVRVATDPSAGGWKLAVDDAAGVTPTVVATGSSLAVDSVGARDWAPFDANRAGWHLSLPASRLGDVTLSLTGTDGELDLANATIGDLQLSSTASRTRLDLASTIITRLSAKTSFGQLSLIVPAASDLSGDLRVTGGELRICVPDGAGLRVTGRGFANGFSVGGAHGDDLDHSYQSLTYTTATHHTDLTVNASFGAVEIDPIGGCK